MRHYIFTLNYSVEFDSNIFLWSSVQIAETRLILCCRDLSFGRCTFRTQTCDIFSSYTFPLTKLLAVFIFLSFLFFFSLCHRLSNWYKTELPLVLVLFQFPCQIALGVGFVVLDQSGKTWCIPDPPVNMINLHRRNCLSPVLTPQSFWSV